MKFALHQITSMKASMEEDLRSYRQAGWTAFELLIDKADACIKQHDLQSFIALVKQSGLKPVVCSGHAIRAFASADQIRADEKDFARKLEILESLECPVMVFGSDAPSGEGPGPQGHTERQLAERDKRYRGHLSRLAEQIGKLAAMADARGVSLALEVNWCALCRSVVTAAEVIRLVNRDNVGLVFDCAHFANSFSRLADLELLKDKIVAVHLNDLRGAPPEVRDVNMDRVLPGEGVLPLTEWLRTVERLGFKGYHAVEVFSEDLWAKPALDIARQTMTQCRRLWPQATF
jgi:2-keto-myo-inositol isomerase